MFFGNSLVNFKQGFLLYFQDLPSNPCFFAEKQGTSEKGRIFLSAEPLKSFEKRERRQKSKEDSKTKKARKKEKSKDWRVRELLEGLAGDTDPWLISGFSLAKQKNQGKEGQVGSEKGT